MSDQQSSGLNAIAGHAVAGGSFFGGLGFAYSQIPEPARTALITALASNLWIQAGIGIAIAGYTLAATIPGIFKAVKDLRTK